MALNKPLTGQGAAVALDRTGWTLRAPGVLGRVEISRPSERGTGTRGPDLPTPDMSGALARADMTELATLQVQTERVEAAPQGTRLRAPSTGGDALELEVPALPDYAQVVLLTDESGALSWHFPVDAEVWPESERSATRGGGGPSVTFRIPNVVVPPSPGAEPTQRSLVQLLGKKVLKVLVYPATDPILKVAMPLLAGAWESKHRKYRARAVGPADYTSPDAPDLAPADWARLAEGRALLFLHGTFSTTHDCFQKLPVESVQALHSLYGGRVFGFDHPTLSESPSDNVAQLLARVPPDVRLDLDVVCHSRGGLVARTLQQRPNPFGLDTSRIDVRRTVFVGVPNDGTLLADASHIVNLLDRFTNLLNLFPTGAVGEVLDAVLIVVKVAGRGALNSLRGLMSMRPGGDFLAKLNAPGAAGEYYAVAADYEPTDSGLRRLVKAAGDAAVDRVFEGRANDLVVPEPGVYEKNGGPGFPLPAERVLRLASDRGVVHTTMFGQPDVQRSILAWLTA